MPILVKELREPSETQIQQAAHVLHEAFEKRYFLFALGGDKSLVEPFLLAHVRATVIGGSLYIAELPDVGIVGVALWFGPGQKFLSSEDQLNAGWNQTMDVLDESLQIWWKKFLIAVDEVADKLYGRGKQLAGYHLQTFGVLPSYQKKGYGTALMKSVERKAKQEGNKDVVLETLGEDAVPVYSSMGFEVLGPVEMDTGKGKANAYGFRKHFE